MAKDEDGSGASEVPYTTSALQEISENNFELSVTSDARQSGILQDFCQSIIIARNVLQPIASFNGMNFIYRNIIYPFGRRDHAVMASAQAWKCRNVLQFTRWHTMTAVGINNES